MNLKSRGDFPGMKTHVVKLSLLSFALAAAPLLQAQTVSVAQTSADQTYLLTAQPNQQFGSGGGEPTTITVGTSTGQTWQGVGAALTDASACMLYNGITATTDCTNNGYGGDEALSAADESTILTDLFDEKTGIGLRIIRLPMGASDMTATANYNYDKTVETDPSLPSFSITHDTKQIIPILQQVLQAYPKVKIFALPWSPPGWMKSTGTGCDEEYPGCGDATMDGGYWNKYYNTYLVNYFVKFVQDYEAQSPPIPITALTIQNEPLFSSPDYPTMDLPYAKESSLIQQLYSALQTAGLSTVPGILGYEHTQNSTGVTYADYLLSNDVDDGASELLGISWHCYSGVPSSMESVAATNYMTECESTGGSGHTFSWNFIRRSQDLMNQVENGAVSWLDWNMVGNQNDGPYQTNTYGYNQPLVTVTTSSTGPPSFSFDSDYYMLGQIGKFADPGATVLSTSISPSGSNVYSIAFQNPDGSYALVVFNHNTTSTSVTVNWNGTSFNYTLYQDSLVTFTWSPS